MTKKQLSKELNITPAAITYQMRYLVETIDYTIGSKENKYRIEFTESGIEKLKNRDVKKGAKTKDVVGKYYENRKRKLLTIGGGGEV